MRCFELFVVEMYILSGPQIVSAKTFVRHLSIILKNPLAVVCSYVRERYVLSVIGILG